ncbi:pre-60S factor [Colletotrichum truncatum]|uniref:Pre-60S factor n=1 Tax=Colletotrichum truncatum TaxID=5467 RepID=A0ACC3YF81_COLTU|nr:pre-60S factor [Colletotrichum truncatum]KAF6788221.1 pre-60S factor [Colletotrichum truncatum]
MLGTTNAAVTTTTTTMEHQDTSHFKLTATSCGTCAVHFDNPETRRAHSKSQWHVTNLKRRIAGLEPLTAEQHAATEGPAEPNDPTTDSASEESSDSEADAEPAHDFVPEDCLFCKTSSESFDDNVAHMHKAHGMFIPDQDKLIVDLETLVRYLHLVIYEYRECLQCGTQRRTPAAVRQHMVGKNHCRFDIDSEDSEFRGFYEDSAAEDSKEESDTRKAISEAAEEGSAIHLPSGKTISHRSDPAASRPRTKARTAPNGSTSENLLPEVPEGSDVDESKASQQLTAPGAGKKDIDMKALTRAEKRDVVFETQLARLSINDRTALAHLPVSEQRSVLLTQQKQLEKAERAARRLQTRLEMKTNKTAQGHFVNDVPGRKNG